MKKEDFKTAKKVVGIKQATKAIEKNNVLKIVVANDVDEKILKPFLVLCKKYNIPTEYVESKKELGALSGIQVGTAVVAFLK